MSCERCERVSGETICNFDSRQTIKYGRYNSTPNEQEYVKFQTLKPGEEARGTSVAAGLCCSRYDSKCIDGANLHVALQMCKGLVRIAMTYVDFIWMDIFLEF